MSVIRKLTGWDVPVTRRVVDVLLPEPGARQSDLSGHLIVVPTRHAGRRLREMLAQRCAKHGSALLAPRVVSPPALLRVLSGSRRPASASIVRAVWADVLTHERLEDYTALFPACPADQGLTWALQTGRMIQQLRDALADDGTMIRDVVAHRLDDLPEPERWQDLARLEAAFLARMADLSHEDPVALEIRTSADPVLPDEIEQIVIAAVPDPTRLMIQALERLADRIAITVLVHAPEDMASAFDAWGRPAVSAWRDAPIDIPDPEANLILAGTPADQARYVAAALRETTDVAIGVPDRSVIPALTTALMDAGLTPYDPAGSPLSESTCCTLLRGWTSLVEVGTLDSLRVIFRHPDLLAFLEAAEGIRAGDLLIQWDRFQNRHLPLSVEDVVHHLGRRPVDREEPFAVLDSVVRRLLAMADEFRGRPAHDAASRLLELVYGVRTLDARTPDDQQFASAANELTESLVELNDSIFRRLGLTAADTFQILWSRLADRMVYADRPAEALDLEGWLELPWNDAPLLIVTGMNEGRVPDSHTGDVFLPNALREQLGLRDDGDRFARDAYLMRAAIESRRNEGRTLFIAGKTSAEGDPLKPSRLLFRCPDDDLSGRVRHLFGDPGRREESAAPTVSFALDPRLPDDGGGEPWRPAALRVTSFRDYLACPFRFYLGHALGMESVTDLKSELDGMDFGSLVHHALHCMASDETMAMCLDPDELARFLGAEAERRMRERYGPRLPLQLEIQLNAARQRLAAAARIQADSVREGWEIWRAEHPIRGTIGSMEVTGRIDRIDRHSGTGHIRVLDYKSSDRALDPAAAHFGTFREWTQPYAVIPGQRGPRAWIDLQLPLYRDLLRGEFPTETIYLGYFNLPKATQDTSVCLWDVPEESLHSAAVCAAGVVADVCGRRFWPPADHVDYDAFAALFHGDIDACFLGDAFREFLHLAGSGGGGA